MTVVIYRYPHKLFHSMSTNSKYGLRNASDFLNIIRRKYTKQTEESNLMHNKTFIQQESLELYENGNKDDSEILSEVHLKTNKDAQMQNLSEIKFIKKPQNSFCDRLVVKNLQQTLKIYEEDLEILTDNKLFLEEKIDFMSEKIRKLKELETNNKLLAKQNERAKQYLAELIREYHQSMHLAFKSKIHQQEMFNSYRSKIRMVLKEMGEDYYYIGFVQYWNNHVETLMKNRRQIDLKIKDEIRVQNEKAQHVKVVKVIPVTQKVSKMEDDEFLTPDEPKPKKKMSESQRASLLGDLKSFAKNFKFPNP